MRCSSKQWPHFFLDFTPFRVYKLFIMCKIKGLLNSKFSGLLLGTMVIFTLVGESLGENIDERFYRFIRAHRSPFMDQLMYTASDLGDTKVVLGVILLFSTYGNQYQRDTAKLAFTSVAITQTAVGLLKLAVNRPRPDGRFYPRKNSSFPSGHVAGSLALASIVAARYPRYRIPCYAMATLVAYSRVYLGRHYPGDVVGGALLGYLASKGVLHFQQKILKFEF